MTIEEAYEIEDLAPETLAAIPGDVTKLELLLSNFNLNEFHNELPALPARVTTLSLILRDLNDKELATEFPPALARMPESLKVIEFGNGNFYRLEPAELANLVSLIPPSIEVLSFIACPMGYFTQGQMSGMIGALPAGVKTLKIRHSGLCNGTPLEIITGSLPPNIKALDLACNSLGSISIEKLARMFAAITASVATLNLSGNRLGQMSSEKFQAFGAALTQCRSLQTINLSDNHLGQMSPEGLQALGEALVRCSSLHSVDLAVNGSITTLVAQLLLNEVLYNVKNKNFLFRENLLPKEYSESKELSEQLIARLRSDGAPLASLTLALLLSCGWNTVCIQGLHADSTSLHEALDSFKDSLKEPEYLPMVQTVLYFMHGFVESIINNKPDNYDIEDVENLKSFFYELNDLCREVDAKASLFSFYLEFKQPTFGVGRRVGAFLTSYDLVSVAAVSSDKQLTSPGYCGMNPGFINKRGKLGLF